MMVIIEDVQDLEKMVAEFIDECDVEALPELSRMLNKYSQIADAEYEYEMEEADGD